MGSWIWYIVAFFAALAVDSVPVFAPPAWTVLLLILSKFDLNAWLVLTLGVIGSCVGRLILMSYIPALGKRGLSAREGRNLEYLGKQLEKSGVGAFVFVLLYTLTPLSTTALFTAAGLAKARKLTLIAPFAIGKFISDGLMLLGGKYAVDNFSDIFKEMATVKGIALGAIGLVVLGAFLLVDWRMLLERKQLKLQFDLFR